MTTIRISVVLAALLLAMAPQRLHAQLLDPDVRAEPALVDFGDLRPGESATRTVEVYNNTNGALHIHEARPNCNCTVVSVASKIIEPGKSVSISISFLAYEKLGPIEPHIVVTFRERIRPLRIPARAHVNLGIRFNVVRVQPELEYPVEIELIAIDGSPFRVLAVNGRPKHEGDPPAVTQLLRLERPAPPGERPIDPALSNQIVIETDHPTAPVVLIDTDAKPFIRVSKEPGPWNIVDRTRILGWVRPGEQRELEAVLNAIQSEPFSAIERIRVRSSTADAGLLGISQAPNGLVVRLFLEVHESTPPDTLVSAALEITIGDYTRTLTLVARTPSDSVLE